MDEVTVREFLFQISRYADSFIKHKFHNVASLRCLKLPEDLNFILGDSLSLGELRQIEHALLELKTVPIDEPPVVAVTDKESPVMKKICTATEFQMKEKKRELYEVEKELAELEMPIAEPAPQGTIHYRCTNCHIRGHKADNNKGSSVCKNEKCTDYRLCGQKDRHKEYKEDRKAYQFRVKKIKTEIADFEVEILRSSAFQSKSSTSFTKVVKERLRKTNPVKYAQSSVLMHDLMLLKSAYDNKIPPISQNDKTEFAQIVNKMSDKIKKEYNSDSSSNDSSPPCKKMCTVNPQKYKKAGSQMHYSDYVPNVYSPGSFPPMPCVPYIPQNPGNMFMNYQPFFSLPGCEPMFQQPPIFFQRMMQPYPTAPVQHYQPDFLGSDDSEDENTDRSKPKIWSPALL